MTVEYGTDCLSLNIEMELHRVFCDFFSENNDWGGHITPKLKRLVLPPLLNIPVVCSKVHSSLKTTKQETLSF
jgi:hypothetical protein